MWRSMSSNLDFETVNDEDRISWLDWYTAVKNGDVAAVGRGLRQGLAYSTADGLNVDVMAVAIEFGHLNVMKEIIAFLESRRVEKNPCNVRVPIILQYFPMVIEMGKKKILKYFLDCLTDLHQFMSKPNVVHLKIRVKETFACSIEKSTLTMLKTLESYVKLDAKWYKSIMLRAFSNGRPGVFEYIMRGSKMTLSQAEKLTGIQEFYLAIAVGQGYEDDYYSTEFFFGNRRLKHRDHWHSALAGAYDTIAKTMGPDSAFAVAARFGKMKMVKHLIEECGELINRHDWELIVRDMYREATHFGHKNIANYLMSKRTKLHISLENHLEEQYSNTPTSSYKTMVQRYVDVLNAKHQTKTKLGRLGQSLTNEVQHKIRNGEEENALVVLTEFGNLLGSQRLHHIFLCAVKYRRLEVIIYLLDEVRLSCPFTPLGHQAILEALTPFTSYSYFERPDIFPNPIILEVLLDAVPIRGSSCPCGEITPMDLFLHYGGNKVCSALDPYDFHKALNDMQLLLRIFAQRGMVPRALTLKKLFRQFFSRGETTNLVAARLICLADWLDLTDIFHLEILGSGVWFQVRYPDRDAFIFHLVRSLCGSKSPSLRWNGLLSYISKRERQDKFVQLFQEAGVRIHYPNRSEAGGAHHVAPLVCRNSVVSLQALCRREIYRIARQKSTNAFVKRQYLPLSAVVRQITQEFFPHLRDFMSFI